MGKNALSSNGLLQEGVVCAVSNAQMKVRMCTASITHQNKAKKKEEGTQSNLLNQRGSAGVAGRLQRMRQASAAQPVAEAG